MALEKGSNQPSVHDFFVNPIRHQSVVADYFNADENMEYLADEHLSKYLNEKAITEMIQVNSEITNILSKFQIRVKINMNILNNLIKNHMSDTRKIALGIANHLPQELKTEVNHKALAEATSLHDLAKAIIPEHILNKAGALNPKEREIMEEHATLSYELLKTTDLSPETLDLIKHHHQNPQKSGYPHVEEGFKSDINLQILSIADIYSALREKRSYKAEMSVEQSLEIINKETQQGKFSTHVYNALVRYTREMALTKRDSKWKIFDFKPVDSLSA